MDPQSLASLALFALQEAIKLEPKIAEACQALFASGDPSPAEWEATRLLVSGKTYRDYVPDTAIPSKP